VESLHGQLEDNSGPGGDLGDATLGMDSTGYPKINLAMASHVSHV
jgi:hypothetical protein